MLELLRESFISVNLLPSVLLILVLLYWLMVILGALDIAMFHIDLDADAHFHFDTHVDGHIDTHVDGDAGTPSFLHSVLEFFYIGEVPVMILASIFILSSWMFSILGNYFLNPGRGILLGSGIAAGNLFISLFVTKFFALPFRSVFKALDSDPNAPKKVIGRIGIVLTSQISDKLGQLEIQTQGAPILLNARTKDGTILKKGQEALVIELDESGSVYYVEPVKI